MKALVTGGAGYLGSCICCAMIDCGHTPIILDSLVSGREYFVSDKIFYKGDISDIKLVEKIFSDHSDLKYTIHCAERASVGSSVFNPYDYYISNVVKGIELFKALHDFNCPNIIFGSTSAIYDNVAGFMVTENSPVRPQSPFARSKYIFEMILQDFCRAYDMRCITMRYFNPIGADPSLRTGLEEVNSSNIISRLIRAMNDNVPFTINGGDWNTRDGTCIRDYVHVYDAAMAHVKALENYEKAFSYSQDSPNYLPINIGAGLGSTVKEVVLAFENIIGEKVNIKTGDRRLGDVVGSYPNISLAEKAIGWKCRYTMEEAILDAVRWEEKKKEKLRKNM